MADESAEVVSISSGGNSPQHIADDEMAEWFYGALQQASEEIAYQDPLETPVSALPSATTAPEALIPPIPASSGYEPKAQSPRVEQQRVATPPPSARQSPRSPIVSSVKQLIEKFAGTASQDDPAMSGAMASGTSPRSMARAKSTNAGDEQASSDGSRSQQAL